jgi:hypothetical protein
MMDLVYSTIEFYDQLKLKYNNYLKPEIVSIIMVQTNDQVLLETREIEIVEGGFEKQTTNRIDLGFISNGDGENEEDFFNPKDTIENNVKKFINELSPYSIINTTDLFSDEACDKISKKYNTFGVDK